VGWVLKVVVVIMMMIEGDGEDDEDWVLMGVAVERRGGRCIVEGLDFIFWVF